MPAPNDLPRARAGAVRAVVASVDDTGAAQTITAQTHPGVVRSGIEVASIHGLASNPGAGAEALLLAIEGDQGHYVALPLSLFGWRYGRLPPGGVCLYDAAGNRISFPADGTGTLTTAGLMSMITQSLSIQTQAGAAIHGPVAFSDAVTFAGPVTFQAAVTFQQTVTVNADLHVAGAITGATVNGR